jgi:hypothetical protein
VGNRIKFSSVQADHLFEAQKPTEVATDTMYAWVTVKVYASGKVHMDAYGFDQNFGETKVIKSWDLEAGF